MPKGKKKRDVFTKCSAGLLNFYYEESPETQSFSQANGRKPTNLSSSSANRFRSEELNRDNYVAGRFKFCLARNSKANSLVGQDRIAWSDVERVIVEADSNVSCPICLSQVVSPRMTNCGHIFCWLCIKRMFMHSREVWDNCPLCYSFIREKDLRRVFIQKVSTLPKLGEEIEFNLIQRYSSCIVCTPVDEEKMEGPFHCFSHLPLLPGKIKGAKLYSRLYTENPLAVEENLLLELTELREAIVEAAAFSDTSGVELLKSLEAEVSASYKSNHMTVRKSLQALKPNTAEHNSSQENQIALENEPITYLYIWGTRNIFMHPFNVRCLIKELGNMNNFPVSLPNVKVLDVENVVLTVETKKRYPFLAHLPTLTTITFLEVDVRRYLTIETKESLKEEFRKRQLRREKKRKTQRRLERISKSSLKKEWLDQIAQFDSSLMPRNVDSGYVYEPPEIPEMESVNPVHTFATIVNENGHFPSLEESNIYMSKSVSPPKSPWTTRHEIGNDIKDKTLVDEGTGGTGNMESTELTKTSSNNATLISTSRKRRGKGKKVSLYSNTHHRTYR